jgi:hypothetical protein
VSAIHRAVLKPPILEPPAVQTHRAPTSDRLYTYDFCGGGGSLSTGFRTDDVRAIRRSQALRSGFADIPAQIRMRAPDTWLASTQASWPERKRSGVMRRGVASALSTGARDEPTTR